MKKNLIPLLFRSLIGSSVLATSAASAQTEHLATAVGSEMSDTPGFSVSNSDLLQTSLDTVIASSLIDGTGVSGDEFLADKGEPTLRDGIWGNNEANSRGTAAVQNDEFAEYLLDLTTSPGGYTISGIDFFTNWGTGQGRDEVRVNVAFSLVGTPTVFDQTLVVAAADPLFVYNPPTQTQGKLSLSGFSIPGVAAVRFDWPSQQESNAVGYSEIDVFGTSTGGDIDAPTLSGTAPATGAIEVATTAPLTLTFNEDIQAGTGIIDLRSSTPDASIETFDVASSAQLSFSGRALTITPTSALNPGVEYYLVVPSGAIDDLAANNFAGIPALPDAAAFTFTTDATAPILGTLEPLLNGLTTSDLTLQFSEAIQLGVGQVTLHLASDDSIVETIAIPSAAVSVDGDTVVIDIADLMSATAYYVNFSAGAIADLSGNAASAVSDNTSISFSTAATTLIHHWEFEDTADDSAGTHDGTLRGNTGFTVGQIGQALSVASAGNGVNVDRSSLPATNYTLAVWINPTETGTTRHIAGTRRGNTEGAQLKIQGGIPTVHLQSESNVVLQAPQTVLAGEWTHLAYSVDATNGLTIYVNGVSVATDPLGLGHTVVDNFTVRSTKEVLL